MKARWLVILASRGITLVEYCLAVPTSRNVHAHSTPRLKTWQEVIPCVVFEGFWMRPLRDQLTLGQDGPLQSLSAPVSHCAAPSISRPLVKPPPHQKAHPLLLWV
ncbi:DMT family protein [Phaeobacter sp. 22II1-1F12B]|uniref:DMT family protein n=1 Tax=Phaeobacter sp. 22II1-1F12B TaxID=1317111 RepID=UPI0011870357